MSPRDYITARLDQLQPEYAWKKQGMEKMRAWQSQLRSKVKHAIGLPREKPPLLEVSVHEVKEFPQYSRETIRFHSRVGMEVMGYFLLPKKRSSPLPVVVCLPGHGYGVDSIVGIQPDGTMRAWREWGDYQKDFALQCVDHGYAAFAIEQASFGYRRDDLAIKSGPNTSSCTRDSMAALMLGETMTGWRVWDAMRAIDYVLTRPEVDPRKVATMGISGGGLTSLFTACLDLRVKVAVVSGYLNTWRDSVLSIDHCVDNFVPGLLNLCEMPDMAGLCASRYLFAESGMKDPIFPLRSFQKATRRVEEIYSAFGTSDHFGFDVFDADHQFHGVKAFQFLRSNL